MYMYMYVCMYACIYIAENKTNSVSIPVSYMMWNLQQTNICEKCIKFIVLYTAIWHWINGKYKRITHTSNSCLYYDCPSSNRNPCYQCSYLISANEDLYQSSV